MVVSDDLNNYFPKSAHNPQCCSRGIPSVRTSQLPLVTSNQYVHPKKSSYSPGYYIPSITTTASFLSNIAPRAAVPFLVGSSSFATLHLVNMELTPSKFAFAKEAVAVVVVLQEPTTATVFGLGTDPHLALWHALVDSGHPSGYDKVISQWERMCEFDPSSPLLHNDTAFEMY
ncbi:hypothetical protein FRB99_006200, partial [Tulasnella sp. 403]